MKGKLNSVRVKGYIQVGEQVKSFTNFFPVAKTRKLEEGVKIIDKIRMVYDATKSYLNDAVWDPWLSLPTIDLKLRSVKAGTYICVTVMSVKCF